jgi:hypothetical protein
VRLGVAAGLPLEFNTIDTIKDLFGKHSVYIYGISDKPIDYYDHDDCFDIGILETLTGLKNEDEFKAKLKCIAELRKVVDTAADDGVVCLLRNRTDDHADDAAEYNPFDLGELWFEFFEHCSSLDAEFDIDRKASYDTVGSAHNFMKRIKESVDYFKSLGISEEHIDITHYNVLSI